MKTKKTIRSAVSGHTLCIVGCNRADLPAHITKSVNDFTTFYRVCNFDESGHVFMYLAKGHELAPKQICAWYAKSGAFWSGYGTTFQQAIEEAQKAGWMYA